MTTTVLRRAGAALALCVACIGNAWAFRDDTYHHDAVPLPAQSRWMSTLHDTTPLNALSVPGTHASAARHGGDDIASHVLTIRQQLDAGVRYLDLRAQLWWGNLALYHRNVSQQGSLHHALKEITAFLAANPSETVFVRLREESVPHSTSAFFASALDRMYPEFGHWFAGPVRLDTPLGSLRGKIVLLRQYAGNTRFPAMDFARDYIVQDNWHVDSSWWLYRKWEAVKFQLDASNRLQGTLPFLNHLSGGGGVGPWFVASGHQNPRTDALPQGSGQWRPWSNPFPDFPTGACVPFYIACEINYEGMNRMATLAMRNNDALKYVGIVASDFPGSGLIAATIDVNRTQAKFVSAKNGQCLDLEGGVRGRLITWPCHGAFNQRFTVRGASIRVAGKCLDVTGGQATAPIILWSCHGGGNQQWRVEPNGMVRSLMGNQQLCLANVSGNRVELRQCNAGNTDQRFASRQH